MIDEPTPPSQQESFDPYPVEDQKTRLWAMSFESTSQLVNCTNCGAITTVPRLVVNPDTVPERRRQLAPEVQTDTGWQRHFEEDLPVKAGLPEPKKKNFKIDDKVAVKVLSLVSATLLVSLVGVIFKQKKHL